MDLEVTSMAKSPSHQLGEIIGSLFENIMKEPIKELCSKYNVYFDSYGPRAARGGNKLTWLDINGSRHDLDYVIEKGGTEQKLGTPIGFIELAWRRYTKHSKNKVQEISGAVLPIAQKYSSIAPFKGAILSGDFTGPSIQQLVNQDFCVLYIPFENVVEVFKGFNIDIYFDEQTQDSEFLRIISKVKELVSESQGREAFRGAFIAHNDKIISNFLTKLENFLKRQISYISVIPLHGRESKFVTVDQTINFLISYHGVPTNVTVNRYIIEIVYNDGSRISCDFREKSAALNYLRNNNFSLH